MKLTKYDREAFVRATLNDIPTADYGAQAQAITTRYERSVLHPEVIAAIDNPHVQAFIRPRHELWLSSTIQNPRTYDTYILANLPETVRAELDACVKAHLAARNARYAVKCKLQVAIAACTTLKQAQTRLPEFSKYLPADRDTTGATNLPVVSNVVTDLAALGWPKAQEPAGQSEVRDVY